MRREMPRYSKQGKMKAVAWFGAKCVCVTVGAMAGTFALNPAFSSFWRAVAAVLASGAGALLAYLLNPTQAPSPVLTSVKIIPKE